MQFKKRALILALLATAGCTQYWLKPRAPVKPADVVEPEFRWGAYTCRRNGDKIFCEREMEVVSRGDTIRLVPKR